LNNGSFLSGCGFDVMGMNIYHNITSHVRDRVPDGTLGAEALFVGLKKEGS